MTEAETFSGDSRHPSADGPDSASSSTAFQLAPKVRDKMNRLAKWRIDPAALEFLRETPEFHGGYAVVSQALLATKSGNVNGGSDHGRAGGENESDGKAASQKAVAVKKLKTENEKDLERVLKLALREAGILAELSHESIINLEGFVEDMTQAKIWLVFPWAENGNLRDFVAAEDWEIPERIWLIDDVSRGVEYLHTRDPPICHGDLKSVNVLVNSDFRAVIIDFGSARRLAGEDSEAHAKQIDNSAQPVLVLEATVCASTNTLTLTGNEYTLRWAAPELLNDEEPRLPSDVWALGWIFYEVMTNRIPFEEAKNESTIINNVIQGELPSVTEHARMSLILRLCSIMIECWSIDPSKRPTAQGCRKSINHMPMVRPAPQRTGSAVSRARSPALLMELGLMHQSQNDYASASRFFNEALDASTKTSNLNGKANALWGLANVHRLQNKDSEAIPLYSQALDIWTNIGDKQGRATALFGLADAHRRRANYDEAITLYTEALQIRTDVGDRKGRASTLLGLAEMHRLQRNYGEAIVLYSEAAEICTDIGDRWTRAFTLWGLAEVHRLQREYTQAVELFTEALQIRTDIGDRHGRGFALLNLAHTHRDQDHYTDALSLYEQAAEIFQQIGNSDIAASALRDAANVRQRLERMSAD